MTYRFVARSTGADTDRDHDCVIEAGISEGEDGSGFLSLFQRNSDESNEQDISVQSVDLTGNVARLPRPAALPVLGLDDTEIEAVLEAPAEDIARFREVLSRVLAYGREEARPARVAV